MTTPDTTRNRQEASMTDQTAEQRMAEVMRKVRRSGPLGVLIAAPELGDWIDHLAAALVAEGFGDVRQAGAEALREAADKWQWGGWTMLTASVKAGSVIGAAQVVTDWLRECAKNGGAR